jgi:hypothetical protein
MKPSKHIIWRCVGVFVLFLSVAGCSRVPNPSAPLDIEDIPVPPDSVFYWGGPYEAVLDMAYATTRSAFGVSNHNCEVNQRYFLLEGPGYGLDKPLEFYQTAFADTDWRLDETLDLPGVRRWTRSSTAGTQTLTIGIVPLAENDSDARILWLILVTGKLPCRP